MMRRKDGRAWILALVALAVGAQPALSQVANISFFLVPEGPTRGADLGAIFTSDAHCTDVAYAVGFGDRDWRAYLDGTEADGEADQVARERIGSGPWVNFAGVVIAETLEQLHSDQNNLNRMTALTIQGEAAPEGFMELPRGSELRGSAFSRAGPFLCFAAD